MGICLKPVHLIKFLRYLINKGIIETNSFQERRRIRVINAAGLLGGTSSLGMIFPNLYHGHYILAILNVVTWLVGYSVFFIHTSGHSKALLILVGLIYSIAAALSATLYHNNVEFFLLIYAGVYFIVLDDIRVILVFSLINILLFLCIFFGAIQVKWFAPVSPVHRHLVIMNGIALFFFFLYYFKKQSQSYLQELELRNKELDTLNYNKEKLFGIMAHDLKQPVASLMVTLQMTQEGYLTRQEAEAMFGQLLKQVVNVHENLSSILDWSKSQLRGMAPSPARVCLLPVVTKVVAFIQPSAQTKSLDINFSGVTDEQVWIDPDHLALILRNLLSNAVKFSYPGGIIDVRSVRLPDSIELEVQDYGKGISQGDAEQLQNKFSFFSTYGTANEKGTGLGLNLCKEFISQNGGFLRFRSEEGRGSCFIISMMIAN